MGLGAYLWPSKLDMYRAWCPLYVFVTLVIELWGMGHGDSRHGITLEEQLAIFLYMCVTGLSVQHTGEHFQRSNETIAR